MIAPKRLIMGRVALGLVACLLLSQSAIAEVRLPTVFGDSMVLQREIEIPVWGWANSGETVTVRLGDTRMQVTADDNGRFLARLPAREASSDPVELRVTGSSEVICRNVLVGEVWLASGQSNMEWSVARANNAESEIEAADHPTIRLFRVPEHVVAGAAQDDVAGEWNECSPQTIGQFSAVAYYFGRKLSEDLDVPIGLIDTSWGGTRIEPWTPPEGFAAVEQLADISKQIADANAAYAEQLRGGEENPAHPLAAGRGQPTSIYNAMVHGIAPYGIRGAIWYQGESNRGDGMLYYYKMKALISGWRKVWDQGDFPFYFVQLAPYRYNGSEVALCEMWEAQTRALSIPNTGMAVTVDVGNVGDIHPRDKQTVGSRLALWALANNYGQEDLVYSGPLYASKSVEDNTLRISFHHAGGGLSTSNGAAPSHFEIAGANGEFVEATAEIDGDEIVLSAEGVANPIHARYGWHQEAEPNLINKAGLPASPFRTNQPRSEGSETAGATLGEG